MELRSKRRATKQKIAIEETQDLHATLSAYGIYENDMDLEEMRGLLSALKASMGINEVSAMECDELMVFKEHDFEFQPPMGEIHNSTMLNPNNFGAVAAAGPIKPKQNKICDSSPFSSPEVAAEKILVQVDVHHAHVWSPPALSPNNLQHESHGIKRKLLTTTTTTTTVEHNEASLIEVVETNDTVGEKNIDSGVNTTITITDDTAVSVDWKEDTFSSSVDLSQDYNVTKDSDEEWLP